MAKDQNIPNSTMIPESTTIPESALILQEDAGHDESPQIMGAGRYDEGEVPESLSTAATELPAPRKDKGAAIKKNLPIIIFGFVAAGLMGAVGIKFMGASTLVTSLAYLGALTFGFMGVLKCKAYGEQSDGTLLKVPVTYMAIAAILAALGPEFLSTGTGTIWGAP